MEKLLFVLNLFFLPFILILTLEYSRKFWKLKLVNPLSLAFSIFFPIYFLKVIVGPAFLLDDGLFDKYYQFALLMENIQLLLYFLMTCFSLHVLTRYKLSNFFPLGIKSRHMAPNKSLFLEWFFLIVGIFIFVLMAQLKFGLVNWLVDPRTGYQYYRVGVGSLYALSLSFISIAFAISMLRVNGNLLRFYKIIFYTIIIYFFGSKGYIVNVLIFSAITLWFCKYRHLNKFIYIFGTSISVLILYNFSLSIGTVSAESILSYFDYYVNSAKYYESYFNGGIDLFYGKIFFTDFWSLIPRGLYSEKPFVYGFIHVNEFFFPGAAERTHTPAFGGPISAFADFGVVGVILFSIFNLTIVYNVIFLNYIFTREFDKSRHDSVFFFLFVILFAPNYMTFFPLLQSIVFSLFLLSLFKLSSRITFGRHHRA